MTQMHMINADNRKYKIKRKVFFQTKKIIFNHKNQSMLSLKDLRMGLKRYLLSTVFYSLTTIRRLRLLPTNRRRIPPRFRRPWPAA